MPIYAYRCDECGFAKDVLQKMSDDPLSVCPSCGKSSFTKQVTAAGFQLKGSGWYVTDFRGGNSSAAPSAKAESDSTSGGASAESASSGSTPASASASTAPASPATPPSAASTDTKAA